MEIRITFDPATGQVRGIPDPGMGPGTVLRVLETALEAHKERMFANEQQPVQVPPPGWRLPFVPNGPKK